MQANPRGDLIYACEANGSVAFQLAPLSMGPDTVPMALEMIAMIYVKSSLEYQYVSWTSRRVAVAGIAVYFCVKWARVVARYDITTNICYHSFGYDIMVISMIS